MRKLKNITQREVQRLSFEMGLKYKQRDVTIGLNGELGAGKTTFTKGFAKALGITRIKSPTFIVAAEYELKKRKLYHIDLYRLSKLDELEMIGLADVLRSKGRVVLIEWVGKFPKIAKLCDIIIEFKITGKNTRDVKIIHH